MMRWWQNAYAGVRPILVPALVAWFGMIAGARAETSPEPPKGHRVPVVISTHIPKRFASRAA